MMRKRMKSELKRFNGCQRERERGGGWGQGQRVEGMSVCNEQGYFIQIITFSKDIKHHLTVF